MDDILHRLSTNCTYLRNYCTEYWPSHHSRSFVEESFHNFPIGASVDHWQLGLLPSLDSFVLHLLGCNLVERSHSLNSKIHERKLTKLKNDLLHKNYNIVIVTYAEEFPILDSLASFLQAVPYVPLDFPSVPYDFPFHPLVNCINNLSSIFLVTLKLNGENKNCKWNIIER